MNFRSCLPYTIYALICLPSLPLIPDHKKNAPSIKDKFVVTIVDFNPALNDKIRNVTEISDFVRSDTQTFQYDWLYRWLNAIITVLRQFRQKIKITKIAAEFTELFNVLIACLR